MSFRFFGKPSWFLDTVEAPWGSRPSLYSHILAHLDPESGRLQESGRELPDEENVRAGSGFGWVAGGFDGAFGHHGGGTPSKETGSDIFKALHLLTEKADDRRAGRLYSLLTQHKTLDYIDALMEKLSQDRRSNSERLISIARWIAVNAPDREPVKTAIALLGLFGTGEDLDLLLTLGRHDEFTLYAAVALRNTEENSEYWLWQLGRWVSGWGRIQIVERLAGTDNLQIRDWLLREGYQNDTMLEYTALICARSGELAVALRQDQPDYQVIKGAGSILQALIQGRGGPVEGIESYTEGPEAAELYLRHLQSHDLDLEDFISAATIKSFLEETEGVAHDPALGWPQRRNAIMDFATHILSKPEWLEKTNLGLASDDSRQFWWATEAAKTLGIDTWQVHFDRLRRGKNDWFFVMQTEVPERIDQVIQFAEQCLPLAGIASGPASEMGLGPEYESHTALNDILQGLEQFPGKGWPLIRAGLRSPVVRNRNMAARALASWDRKEWPPEAERLLQRAVREEPNAKTLDLMRKMIDGRANDS